MTSYPVFCAITQEAGQGGIARVSRCIWHVLQKASNNRCKLIKLVPEVRQYATAADKARFIWTMLGESLNHNIDWIMFEHLGLARVQSLIPKPFSRPYAVFIHSVEAWNPLGPGRKRILQQAEVRIANSNYTAQRVAAANPGIGPIEVCHLALLPSQAGATGWPLTNSSLAGDYASPASNQVDTDLLDRIRPNSVLIVGRMLSSERHKGHDYLIDSWPSVKSLVPDAQLVIVGDGDGVQHLKAKALGASLGDSILFTGWVNDHTLQCIYQRAAIFAMPSRGEGFGLVYLEAMQHRLPCIGSPRDAAAEIIEQGVTGFLVDQEDVAGLARNIVTLLQNPSQRQEMGEAGYERLQTVFSFEKFEQRLIAILAAHFGSGRPADC